MRRRRKAGKLPPAEMQGGSFTISNLGGIGGTYFTPIVNAPEVAILGMSRSVMEPVWTGESFEPRLMMPLSLSYDHRVIDGADGDPVPALGLRSVRAALPAVVGRIVSRLTVGAELAVRAAPRASLSCRPDDRHRHYIMATT